MIINVYQENHNNIHNKLIKNNISFSAQMLLSHQLDFLATHEEEIQQDDDDDNHLIENYKKGAFEDIWSSIHKNLGSGSRSGLGTDHDVDLSHVPYVHPLVKRSNSQLSQKSLEVCTESLGSETGSEPGHDQVVTDDVEVVPATWRSLSPTVVPTPTNINTPRSSSFLPPPLPSLSHRRQGANLHMRAHRRDGRLVVEAVSVPSVHRLCALRQDGRLLLTLNQNDETTMLQEEEEDEYDNPLAGPQQNSKVGPQREILLAHYKGKLGGGDGEGEVVLQKPNPNNYNNYCNKDKNKNKNVEEKVEKEEEEEDDEEENQIPPFSSLLRGCRRRSLLLWESDNQPAFCIATS